MVRFALYFALSLGMLGHVGPAGAAQMPEQFRGEWACWRWNCAIPTKTPDPRSEEDLRASVSSSALKAYGPPEQLLRVTPNAVETTGTRCTVTRVAKFDTCPWGQLSKRPSQRNPWGPGYNIKLHCREKDGRTFNLVRDWVLEKGSLSLLPIPSGYRCLLPHPTQPDLPR
jgi:hypothetical protein